MNVIPPRAASPNYLDGAGNPDLPETSAMNHAAQSRPVSATVTAEIPYTVDTGEKLVNETFGPNNIRRRKTGTQDSRQVSIRNGRLHASELSFKRNGFVFVEHKTAVKDFFDRQQLESVY